MSVGYLKEAAVCQNAIQQHWDGFPPVELAAAL
jgi:hypothetical protein